MEAELSIFEAAHVLGCPPGKAKALLQAHGLIGPRGGRRADLVLEKVEEVAVVHYQWRAHLDDPESYWVTNGQAQEILGVNKARVNQLADRGFLPYVATRGRTRLYRREQLETIANARLSRRLQGG